MNFNFNQVVKSALFAVFMWISFSSIAQSAYEGIRYQAILRDASGSIVSTKTVNLRFTIYQKGDLGNGYKEEHATSTNVMGLVNITIGDGIPTQNRFQDINWGKDLSTPFFIKVEFSDNGGTSYLTFGESQLLAVPYAMYAKNVENADDADADPLNEIQDLQLTGDILEITNNGAPTLVDLSKYLDNTDAQVLSYGVDDTLRLTNGGAVYLGYFDLKGELTALEAKVRADSVFLANNINSVRSSLSSRIANDSARLNTLEQNVIAGAYKDSSSTNELNSTVILNGNDLDVTDAGGTKTADLSPLNQSSEVSLLNTRVTNDSLRLNGVVTDVSGLDTRITNDSNRLNGIETGFDTRITNDSTRLNGVVTDVSGLDTRITNDSNRLNGIETGFDTRITNDSTRLNEVVTDVSGLDSRITNDSTRLNGIETGFDTRITNDSTRLNGVVTDVSGLDSRITNDSTRLNGIETGFDTRITNDSTRLNGVVTDVSGLDTRITNDSTRLNGVVTDVSGLDSRITNDSTRLNGIETGFDTRITNDSTRLNGVVTDVSGLDSRITNDSARLNGIETGFDTRITNDSTRLNGVVTDVSGLDSRITNDSTRLNGIETGFDTRITNDSIRLNGVVTDVSGLDSRITNDSTRLNGIETGFDTRITNDSTRLNGVVTDVSGLDSRISNDSTRLNGVVTDVSGLDTRITNDSNRLNGIETDLSTLEGNYKVTQDSLSIAYDSIFNHLNADLDIDTTNEIQAISLSNDTIFLTDGGFVKLPAGAVIIDNDSTNEKISSAIVSNDTLITINENGNVTQIPLTGLGARVYQNEQDIADNISDISDLESDLKGTQDSVLIAYDTLNTHNNRIGTNETDIVNLETDLSILEGNYKVTQDSLSVAYDSIFNHLNADLDIDTTNEIQAISLSNDTIFLTDGGFVKLPAGAVIIDNDSTNEKISSAIVTNDTLITINENGNVTQIPLTGLGARVYQNEQDIADNISDISVLESDLKGTQDSLLTAYDTLNTHNNRIGTNETDIVNIETDLSILEGNYKVTQDSLSVAYDSIFNHLNADLDIDTTNEIQAISLSNDTIFLTDGGFVKLPAGTVIIDNDSTNEKISSAIVINDTLITINENGNVTQIPLTGLGARVYQNEQDIADNISDISDLENELKGTQDSLVVAYDSLALLRLRVDSANSNLRDTAAAIRGDFPIGSAIYGKNGLRNSGDSIKLGGLVDTATYINIKNGELISIGHEADFDLGSISINADTSLSDGGEIMISSQNVDVEAHEENGKGGNLNFNATDAINMSSDQSILIDAEELVNISGDKGGQSIKIDDQGIEIESDTLNISSPKVKIDADTVQMAGRVEILNELVIPTGKGNGQVLTSDGDGKATWQPPAAVAITPQDLDSVLSAGNDAAGDSILNLSKMRIGTKPANKSALSITSTEDFSIDVQNLSGTGSERKGVFAVVSGSNTAKNFGLYGTSEGSTLENYGLWGQGSGNNNSTKYGVYGEATGSLGLKYGVYGKASGGSGGNYAGYFADGNVHIQNYLGIGTLSPTSPLHIETNDNIISQLQSTSKSGSWLTLGNTDNGAMYYQLITTGTGNAQGEDKLLFGYGTSANTVTGVAMTIDDKNVGIGTSSPTEILDVAGKATIDELNINNKFSLPTGDGSSGQVMETDGNGKLTWITPASGADNLGNHTMTQTLNTGSKWISGDGDNEGIFVESDGRVAVGRGITSSSATLTVKDSTDGNIEIITIDGPSNIYLGSSGNSTSDGSFFSFGRSRGTQLSKTSVQDNDRLFSMSVSPYNGTLFGKQIWNTAVDGTPGTGSGEVPISHNIYSYDASGSTATSLNILSSGNVGINTTNPSARLEVNGRILSDTLEASRLLIPTNAVSGRVLTSDGSGYATWQAPATGSTVDTTLISTNNDSTRVSVAETPGNIDFVMGDTTFWRMNRGSLEALNTGNSVFIGNSSGLNDDYTQNRNTFVGDSSGFTNTTGFDNVFLGSQTGFSNTNGADNTFIGSGSGSSNNSGYDNVFLGSSTGTSNTSGHENVFIGFRSGDDNVIGHGNVYLGYNAGRNETGSDKLFIENSSSSTPLIYGDFATDSLRFNGDVTIRDGLYLPFGTPVSGQVLTTDGNGKATWGNAASSPWSNDNDTIYTLSDYVGIGNSSPIARLSVSDSLDATSFESGMTNSTYSSNTTGNAYGFKTSLLGEVNRSYGIHSTQLGSIVPNAKSYGVYSTVTSSGNGGSPADFYAGYFSASGTHNPSGSEYYGIYTEATGARSNYAFVSSASGGSSDNLAGWFQNGDVRIDNKLVVGGTSGNSFDSTLNVKGGFKTDYIRIYEGATAGKVLTALDNDGNATWQDAPSSPWTLNSDTIYTQNKFIGIGSNSAVSNPEARLYIWHDASSDQPIGLASEVFSVSGTDAYGIQGSVDGGQNIYGVYGSAKNGNGNNWAGYFADGNVKVENDLEISGNLRIPTNAGVGKVLISDGSGNGSWTTPSFADNLGDHTMTTNLETNGNYISNDGDSEGIHIDADGDVTIGGTRGFMDLSVWKSTGTSSFAVASEDGNADFSLRAYGTGVSSDFEIYRARGTWTTEAMLVDNDDIFRLRPVLYNGSGFSVKDAMTISVDGVSGSNTGTRFDFTTYDSDGSSGKRLSIAGDGQVSIGTSTPQSTSTLTVAGEMWVDSIRVRNTASTAYNQYGIFNWMSGSGSGTKTAFLGTTSNGSGDGVGLRGHAGDAGVNKGIEGSASGGTTNWAGYFGNGNVYIQDTLEISTGTPAAGMVLTALDSDGKASWQATSDTLTCPTGGFAYTKVNNKFCINTDERTAVDWFAAVADCADEDADLATYTEWYSAANSLTLTNETNNDEWVSNISQNNMMVVGNSGITNRAFKAPTLTSTYRCVYRK